MRYSHILACAALSLTLLPPLHAQGTATAPVSPPPAAPASPAKEKAIRQLLDVMGMAALMRQTMNQMIATMRTSNPQIPAAFWTKFQARINTDELMTQIVPIYDKYYTAEDISGLLAFYESPLGRKVVAANPQINRESMAVGQEWGRKQALAIVQEMQQQQKASEKGAAGT